MKIVAWVLGLLAFFVAWPFALALADGTAVALAVTLLLVVAVPVWALRR